MPSCPTRERIAIAPGAVLPVRVHAGAGKRRVLHLHGGAFGPGRGGCSAVPAALAAAGATVYSADYPVGSAHPFPEALEAAYAALLRLADSRGRPKLFVAGEEAGGNLAAALALMCRDRLLPKLAGQILLSPMLDPRLATCSVRSAGAGTSACPWALGWHSYLGTPEAASHPYAAPGLALRVAGLAPALLLTGPDDPLADEAAAYAARLRSGGGVAVERRIACGEAWPGALAAPADPEPAWAEPVRDAVAEFFSASAQRARPQRFRSETE